jgi:sialidase-1
MRNILFVSLILCSALIARADDVSRTTVFTAGQGADKSYRIPAAIVTKQGTLLAFAEGRRHSKSDTGEIRLLVKRSSDLGKTFSDSQIVWSDGPNTCGNPCPVIDESTGTIFLLMSHNLGDDHETGIGAGTAKGRRTVWITSSTDDGVTWTPAKEITDSVSKPEWGWYATGPGIGIQLKHGDHAGRLIIPCDYGMRGGVRGKRKGGNSHVIYSDDHGRTWKIGGEPPEMEFNESQVVELTGGRVMLNMRNGRSTGKTTRGVSISDDSGATFKPARRDETLIEPICQASILRLSWPDGAGDKGRILFSNPASTEKRAGMTVRLSEDEGETWSASKSIFAGPSAYSCLVALPDGSIGILYECGEKTSTDRIEFARFNLDWLTDKKPSP